MFFRSRRHASLARPMVFITGAPRSGTSMITKIIDAHPQVGILMENIFGNRRRYATQAACWHNPASLGSRVTPVYQKLNTPIIGNKVVAPEGWNTEDILQFTALFKERRIVFVLRDPITMALSRSRREQTAGERIYTEEGLRQLGLDTRSEAHTHLSSWVKSIQTYQELCAALPGQVYLIYYEDFCNAFATQATALMDWLGLDFCPEVEQWHQQPHHNAEGQLRADLKYPDQPVRPAVPPPSPSELPDDLHDALKAYAPWVQRWQQRDFEADCMIDGSDPLG